MRLRKLLYPFSIVYGGITTLRNKLFDAGVLSSQSYELPIISVGNITVGGTGKTPLTEYLIRLLNDEYKLCLLSRGYKRQTKGAILAQPDCSAETIGDEPFQIMQKFPGINVVVAEKRIEGMELILSGTKTDLVLMDDAYQHRYVKPGFSILVIDYNRPLWKDCPFPAGNLREASKGQSRADIIVVNKCPDDLSEDDKAYWLSKLKATNEQQVFFTTIRYGQPQMIGEVDKSPVLPAGEMVALAGIAQPSGFFNHVNKSFKVVEKMIYPDHHHFSTIDIELIATKLKQPGRGLVTTEKDAVRLKGLAKNLPAKCWFVPIELEILFNEEKQFENRIRNYVRNHSNNS
ncbi:tetraacyldisaccharide 4'-kinase [Carboxylicivirga mesophila]|nr:tetraacyldisaccharide 4'-kinase [Carboxylicivirga mesophila]